MAAATKRQTYQSKSLEKGIAILNCLGDSDGPLPLMELCRQTGLDTGTAYRYLAVLTRHHYVLKDPVTREYSLSYGLFRLAHRPFALNTVARHAHRFLAELSGITGLPASIGALEGRQVVVLSVVGAAEERLDSLDVTDDAHCSAIGKMLLAYRGADYVARLYPNVPLRRHTEETIVSLNALRTELRQAAENGYAVERGERMPNLWAVAGAVVNPAGEANVAIAVAGPAKQFSGKLEAQRGAQVAQTARQIAGYIVSAPDVFNT